MHCYTSTGQTDKLVGALADGPATRKLIARRAGIDYWNVSATLNYLMESKRIVKIGTLGQAIAQGLDADEIDVLVQGKFSRMDAGVYALPTVPLLRPLEPDVETCMRASEQLPGKRKGSVAGPITIGRGFKWFSSGGGKRGLL